jgi:hypothetical protein
MTRDADFTVDIRAGRLVEARVRGLSTRDDADAYGLAVAAAAQRAPAQPVLLADHRAVRVYPQPAADRLVELFRPNNTRYARIAVVVSPLNAILRMQLERLVREARSDHRRVCTDAETALDHLASSLDPRELARARAFLAELGT